MLNNFSRKTLLAGFIGVVSSLSAASFNSLVQEDVNLYVSIRSMADSRAQWEGHPLGAVMQDPEVLDFFEPWFQKPADGDDDESITEVLENDFDLTWEEFFELFPGQMAFALFDLPELWLGETERPELVLMAEYAGEYDQITDLMDIQFERNAAKHRELNPEAEHALIEESFMGETLYFDEVFDGEKTYIEDGFALVDGVFILATPEERLRSAVEAFKDEPETALSEQAAYIRSREEGGRGDLEVYLNLEAILPPLNAALVQKLMQSGAFMIGLNPNSLDTMLALDSMQALFFDLDLTDTGVESHSGLLYREKEGLLSLLSYTDAPLPEARFVPEGVFSTSINNFDVGEMLAQFERLLSAASPNLRAQIDTQLQTARINTGVDLRTAILENFSADVVSLSIMPEAAREATLAPEPDQIYAIALEDAEALSSAIEALKDLMPGVRDQIVAQEFAGQTIHTVKATQVSDSPGVAARSLSYVITRSYLIISMGRPGLLQEVLSNLESGEDGFWQKAETEALFESMERSNVVSRSYLDIEALVFSVFQTMVQTSQFGGAATALDLERIPKNLSVPFHFISETNEASDGLFSRSLLLPKEAAQ